MDKKKIIAIDGPAGAGKSTVSKLVAEKLNYTYIDTGAMYRAVAYKVLNVTENITTDSIISVAKNIDIDLQYIGGVTKVRVDNEDVTDKIRTPEVNKIVSQIAKVGFVREKLTELQRKMGKRGGVIMDGRDIATHVFPNADIKIFLTASIEERARRRYEELKEKGYDSSQKEIEKEITLRDKQDSEREIAPLIRASDAILIDTTGKSIDQVVENILILCLK